MERVDYATTVARLQQLTAAQLDLLNAMIDSFCRPIAAWRLPKSDVVTPEFLVAFGDELKLHHTLSDDYLDKHRFEAVIERVLRGIGRDASRADRCNPGHDLTVDDVPWSLKTQGDRKIRRDILHISKFMELGKGKWEAEADLAGLRDRFLVHLRNYKRIFQLQYFAPSSGTGDSGRHQYELVEIPMRLLREAARGELSMVSKSEQNPKPGYCTVSDKSGHVKFRLYFDGGTERKLQIKDLRKSLCVVHATWEL